jgi:hypothetical protein
MTLQSFAPTNGALVDPKTGKATAAFQIWLRDLWFQAGGSIGIDHGRLIGLADDDHPQYLTNARGDVRYQGLDSDLTAIAALAPTDDDIIQRKAGAWTNRTLAQLLADLGLGALYQPLDGDLTAIAALATTPFGRALLTLADAAAFTALGNVFTDVLKGLVPPPGVVTGGFLRDDGTWAAAGNAESAYTLAGDESTAADTNPVTLTGLEWDFEPNSTYVFEWVGNVSPAAAATGCGFQLTVA